MSSSFAQSFAEFLALRLFSGLGSMAVTGVSAVSTGSPCLSQKGARRSIKMAPSGAVNIIASTEMMSTLFGNDISIVPWNERTKSKATGPKAACKAEKKRGQNVRRCVYVI